MSYNPNSIWGSKEKKYSYDPKNSAVQPNEASKKDIQQSTGAPNASSAPNGPSFFERHKLVFFSLGLLLALVLVGLVFYLLLPPATPNIAITFSDPGQVVLGQQFPLSITVSNKSKSVLKNAQLNITLPNGISFVGEDPGKRTLTEQIDTLSSQTINPPEQIELIVTGNELAQPITGTAVNISTSLTYETATTNGTRYENDANTNIVIAQQPAITISYTAPSSIFSGQNFDLTINYKNNAPQALPDTQLQMQYPPAYNFLRSSIGAMNNVNNLWDLGALAPNATGTFTITGNIVGPAGTQYQLNATPAVIIGNENYPLNATPANFLVTASPLSLSLLLNNTSSYIAKLNDTLNYTLTYTNNSNVTFQGLNAAVTLVGQIYDLSTVKTTGSFNSNNNSITWNAANTPQLLSLAPGQSGSINFSVNTRSSFPIRLINDKNYILKATAQIESPTVPPNTAGSSTQSVTTLSNKVGGVIAITATGYSHDPTLRMVNSGPYPPKAGQPTQYTIHWDITNYSTDAQNVTVSAYLQSGTTFTGQIKSNVVSSTPVYNPSTGLVTWTIPLLPATTGVISSPAEAVFQVSNTPSVTQIGQDVTLLGPTNLSSTDAFTGTPLNASDGAVTTKLPNDSSITTQNRQVTQ